MRCLFVSDSAVAILARIPLMIAIPTCHPHVFIVDFHLMCLLAELMIESSCYDRKINQDDGARGEQHDTTTTLAMVRGCTEGSI